MKTLVERFWERVDVRGPDECWPWKAGKNGGYGTFWIGAKRVKAHRFAYELVKGPIPAGQKVCHSCDNPSCCNPAHLWPGTDLDNMKDCIAKGRAVYVRGERNGTHTHPERTARGERQGLAKLTEAKVHEIRRLRSEGYTLAAIGGIMGVHLSNIGYIVNGQTWRHVSEQQRLPVIEDLLASEEINLLREEQALAEKMYR
jgi:hypothetical protein